MNKNLNFFEKEQGMRLELSSAPINFCKIQIKFGF